MVTVLIHCFATAADGYNAKLFLWLKKHHAAQSVSAAGMALHRFAGYQFIGGFYSQAVEL